MKTPKQKKEIVKALTDMKNLLSSKKRWCKGYMALADAEGIDINPVPPRSKKAEAFCLVGAAHKCARGEVLRKTKKLISSIMPSDTEDFIRSDNRIFYFNDDPFTSHKDVLKAIDKAIKLVKEN